MPVTAALQETFSSQGLPIDESTNDWQAQSETKQTENKEEANAETSKPNLENKEVLSQDGSPKEEKKPEVVEAPVVKVPDFDELIAERSEGKFKKWDEIQEVLNKPNTEFANEQVAQINEYVKNGGKFDENWLYVQNTDFNSISDPYELVAEAMRLEDPDITDKEIEYEIKTKYKTEDWSDDGEEDNEIRQVMTNRLQRDADKSRNKLLEYQKSTSFKVPEKSEAERNSELLKSKKLQDVWEKTVDDSVKDFSKIPVKIDDKETFDISISEDERNEISKLSKSMGTNLLPLLSNFMDKSGNLDVKMLSEGLYKMKNFDKSVRAAYSQALAKGQQMVAKDIKNINFTAEGRPDVPVSKSIGDQIGEGILANYGR